MCLKMEGCPDSASEILHRSKENLKWMSPKNIGRVEESRNACHFSSASMNNIHEGREPIHKTHEIPQFFNNEPYTDVLDWPS